MKHYLNADSYASKVAEYIPNDGEKSDAEVHDNIVHDLISLIQARNLCPEDDIYVLYDFFQNRMVFVTVTEAHQAIAEEICRTIVKNRFPTHAIVIEPDGPSLMPSGVREIVCSDGIFVLGAVEEN